MHIKFINSLIESWSFLTTVLAQPSLVKCESKLTMRPIPYPSTYSTYLRSFLGIIYKIRDLFAVKIFFILLKNKNVSILTKCNVWILTFRSKLDSTCREYKSDRKYIFTSWNAVTFISLFTQLWSIMYYTRTRIRVSLRERLAVGITLDQTNTKS